MVFTKIREYWRLLTRLLLLCALILFCAYRGYSLGAGSVEAAPDPQKEQQKEQEMYQERMHLFTEMEQFTHIPWYYFAAIDQYERSIQSVRRDLPKKKGPIAIAIPEHKWVGLLNPDPEDQNPLTIQYFGGMGLDANGDGRADTQNDEDVLFAMASFLSTYGSTEEDILNGLWEYYDTDHAVRHIHAMAEIFRTFQRLDLSGGCTFPIPRQYNYTYHDTWGDRRGWGGNRIHEGTDIFADYGTPVRSTCFGYVEVMGWNKYGGWRIGIRDVDNVYHYYAHLSGFNKTVKAGQTVKPADVIGYVGSSGYGKPGTQGKFPPHLHYGMYKHNGRNEWSFDPYPYLRAWERNDFKNALGK